MRAITLFSLAAVGALLYALSTSVAYVLDSMVPHLG